MMSRVCSLLTKPFSSIWSYLHSKNIVMVNQEATTPLPKVLYSATKKVTPTIHKPLLSALKSFKRSEMKKDTIFFHGSREHSQDVNLIEKSLLGTRKWFSEDAKYAVSYAFYGNELLGRPLLWKCKLKENIPSLIGKQFSLQNVSPWSLGLFANQFANSFADYGNLIFQSEGAVALLDHFTENRYEEILIGNHILVVEVLEVIVLPDKKELAEKFAETLSPMYNHPS